MLLELARVGEHRNGLSLSKADLEQVIRNFKDTRPVTIGHIKNGKEPKYGDVSRLSIKGNKLLGDVSLLPEVEPLFKKGLYNKWSSGFKNNETIGTYLHHLALLGGEPPAIEGLKVVDFNDGDNNCYFFDNDFKKYSDEEIKKMDEELKKALEGIQKAIEELSKRVESLEKEKGDDKEKTKEDNPTLEEENEDLKKQVKEFSDIIKKTKSESLKKMLDGKIPKEKIELLVSKLENANNLNFSDGKEKTDIYDLISNTFSDIPEAIKEGEINFNDKDDKASGSISNMVNKF